MTAELDKLPDEDEFGPLVHEKGATVYIITITTVRPAIIEDRVWWSNSDLQPIYYILVDPATKQLIRNGGTSEWHFQSVFDTREEAEGLQHDWYD